MLIETNIPHAFYPGSDKTVNALTLRVMMDGMVRINNVYLDHLARTGQHIPPLYQSGVYYDRTVWWEPISALYNRGFGDCKSLSAAWIAQQRRLGVPSVPVSRFVENADGTLDFHILVMLADGKFEDPSRRLGMGEDEVAKFYGPNSFGCCL